MIRPPRRSALFLAAVALAALAVSLALAFASAPRQRAGPSSAQAQVTTARATIVTPTAEPPALNRAVPSSVDKPPLLWTLLTPWALAVDGLAVLGMAAVLALRQGTRSRRRGRM